MAAYHLPSKGPEVGRCEMDTCPTPSWGAQKHGRNRHGYITHLGLGCQGQEGGG